MTTSTTNHSRNQLVFSRLLLPLPLELANVERLLRRLATERDSYPIVLETVAEPDGIHHLLGVAPTQVHAVRHLITSLIPDSAMIGLGGAARPSVRSAGRITFSPGGLPLGWAAAEQMAQSLYTALAYRLNSGEAIVLQTVLGRGIHPTITPTQISDPRPLSIWGALSRGTTPAVTELRLRVRDRHAEHGMEATIRVGVCSNDPARRERFVMSIVSALSVLEDPGITVSIRRTAVGHFTAGALKRPQRLSVPELAALIGWPIGEHPLPGMPPAHPKLLRLAPRATQTECTFARSLFPGDERLVGITAPDSGMHGISVGPTGVGKTTATQHIILGAIEAGLPVVVVDPKHEMPEFLRARIPPERWKDIREIDASAASPLGFNPLDAAGRDPDVIAESILAVFANLFADGWGPRTADIFSASIRTAVRAATPEHPHTLLDLPKLWTDDRFRQQLVATAADDPGLAGFWAWFDSMKPTQRQNVLAAPMNKLRQVLLKPAAVKILGQRNPRFRLRDVFRDNLIILLPTNPALIGEETAALISALAIADVWQAVQERHLDPNGANPQGYVFIDEADRLMHLPISLADALARSRSKHVSWFLAVQGWHQMPPAMQSAAKTNARTKLIFRAEDDDEARVVARMAPELEPTDFMKLGKHQAYLKLVVDGVTHNWALVQTLPPAPAVHDPEEVLRASRVACPPSEPSHLAAADDSSGTIATTTNTSEPPTFGTKRRTP